MESTGALVKFAGEDLIPWARQNYKLLAAIQQDERTEQLRTAARAASVAQIPKPASEAPAADLKAAVRDLAKRKGMPC